MRGPSTKLATYGAYLAGTTIEDFAREGTMFPIGVAPFRVDLLCDIDGVSFDEAWAGSEPSLVDESIPVRYISCGHLIENKLAAGRAQDLVDVDKLRSAEKIRKQASQAAHGDKI